jgi:hypothetical protein
MAVTPRSPDLGNTVSDHARRISALERRRALLRDGDGLLDPGLGIVNPGGSPIGGAGPNPPTGFTVTPGYDAVEKISYIDVTWSLDEYSIHELTIIRNVDEVKHSRQPLREPGRVYGWYQLGESYTAHLRSLDATNRFSTSVVDTFVGTNPGSDSGGESFTPDVVVASSDAHPAAKAAAQFVCTGVNDEQTWLAAKTWLGQGNSWAGKGRIQLTAGSYYLHDAVELYGCTLQGAGGRSESGTEIHIVANPDTPPSWRSAITCASARDLRLRDYYLDYPEYPGPQYDSSLRATYIENIESSHTVAVGAYGVINGLIAKRLHSGVGSVDGSNIQVGTFNSGGGDNSFVNTRIGSGGFTGGGGGLRLHGHSCVGGFQGGAGDIDIEFYECGPIVHGGGRGRFKIARLYGGASVTGGRGVYSFEEVASGDIDLGTESTLYNTRFSTVGGANAPVQTLRLHGPRTRLVNVALGPLDVFDPQGHEYFACGCTGIPNTCECGSGHNHDGEYAPAEHTHQLRVESPNGTLWTLVPTVDDNGNITWTSTRTPVFLLEDGTTMLTEEGNQIRLED